MLLVFSPYAPCDTAGVVNADELVACGRDVEIGLLLVDEERVRHPDVLNELGSHGQGLDARTLSKSKSRIRPELTEVEIQGEVLRVKEEQIRGRGVSRVWQPPLRRRAKSADVATRKHCLIYIVIFRTYLEC